MKGTLRAPRASWTVYAISLVLHVGGAGWLASIEVRRPPPPPTVVEVRSLPKPAPKAETPPPLPPPPPEPAPKAPKAPPPAPAAPPPPSSAPAAAAAPDFGLSLAGGGAGGAGGIAVPTGGRAAPAPVRQAARTLQAAAPASSGGCDEEVVKARAISMPHPAYTDAAREAQVEGKVRVQLTLDDTGKVTQATVVESLGHGLDEAAVAAVREASFSPATQCGKPVASTFTVAVRFAL